MDFSSLFQNAMIAAVVAVGLTQMIKKWLPENMNSKWYQVIFAGLAFTYSIISSFLPENVQNGFLSLAIGSAGYDYILQLIQKAMDRISSSTGKAEE